MIKVIQNVGTLEKTCNYLNYSGVKYNFNGTQTTHVAGSHLCLSHDMRPLH